MEYVEFKLCERMSCMPEDLDRLPEEKFRLWLDFMRTEANADKLKSTQQSFYERR